MLSTEAGMDGQATEARNPGAPVHKLEAHRAGTTPGSVSLDLDHQTATVAGRLPLALDLVGDLLPRPRQPGFQKRLDILIRLQLEQEVDVVRGRAAQPQSVAFDHLGHGGDDAGET